MKLLGEIMRKGTHLVALAIPLGFILLPRELALWLITIAAIINLVHEILRLHHKGFRKFIYNFWGKIYRIWEDKRFAGSSYILTGAALALFLFHQNIAALVMVYIIVGDTAAVFIGKLWGRHTIYARRNQDGTFRKKTVEGSTAFFVASALAGLFIPGISLTWKLAGAAMATVIELISFCLDDNFTVPIIVGSILQLAIYGEFMPFVWF